MATIFQVADYTGCEWRRCRAACDLRFKNWEKCPATVADYLIPQKILIHRDSIEIHAEALLHSLELKDDRKPAGKRSTIRAGKEQEGDKYRYISFQSPQNHVYFCNVCCYFFKCTNRKSETALKFMLLIEH